MRASVRASMRQPSMRRSLSGVARKEAKIQGILASIGDEEDEIDTTNLTSQDMVGMLLNSTPFQVLIGGCIMLNAGVIGGETDMPDLGAWKYIETIFLVVFTCECSLRLYSQGCIDYFSYGDDQLWNIFDFGIVGLGLFDFICEKLGVAEKGSTGISTLFRMIRLLRILRIFKIVRFLKQLYLLAFGFVEAAQAVFWVTVLMVFALYICSIILVRIYGRLLESDPDPEHPDPHAVILGQQFGTIGVSMLSLFELMSDPGNLKIYHILMQDFPMLTVFLLAFVIFGSFGMIALLTGVISESMFEKNQMRAAEERQEKEAKREVMEAKCRELFLSVETDHEGEARIEAVLELLPYVREMFEKFGIEYLTHDIETILHISDTNDSGHISEDEFVNGILSLSDGVRASSIQEVHYLISQMSLRMKKLERLEHAVPELQADMHAVLCKLGIEKRQSRKTMSRHNGYDPLHLTDSHENRDHHRATEKRGSVDPLSKDEQMKLLTRQTDDSKDNMVEGQMTLITKKLDELNANVHQLCKMPVPLNGTVFTLHEVEAASKPPADVECPPVLPELWSSRSSDYESGSTGKLRNCPMYPGPRGEDQRIRPLTPPPPISERRSLLQDHMR